MDSHSSNSQSRGSIKHGKLALRKNAMDLIAFDGNHNGGSSVVGIEVERVSSHAAHAAAKEQTMQQKLPSRVQQFV
ncbi:hypothetical protein J1N35_013013 [Gossypium stocksii]|uniref:Uncharacterized protein n=1 Tax=Gossypium stocksii TaxID=47602 RepID=A0A9D3VRP7_9ROSI|nr:hypothetical protein J1N35_013013 [Gossypium stocksii]